MKKQFTILTLGLSLLISGFVAAALGEAVLSPMERVTATTSKGNIVWAVELAADDEERATGLMYRKSLAERTGMLFRFDETRPIAMWMKNTFVSLDMVFADEAGRVTHIHESAVPGSTDIISSQGPVRYVLEINSGEAKRTGIKVGTKLAHPWFVLPN